MNLRGEVFTCSMETTETIPASIVKISCCDIFKELGNKESTTTFSSEKEFLEYFKTKDCTFYFHNLEWYGPFIVYMLNRAGYQSSDDKMNPGKYKLTISGDGKWYNITIYWKRVKVCGEYVSKKCEIYDSKKVIPMSLDEIKDEFGYSDVDMHSDCIIGRVLADLFMNGFQSTTLSGYALQGIKKSIGHDFKYWFPVLSDECDEFCRHSYKGGICQVSDLAYTYTGPGVVYDKNSMYPWVMLVKMLPFGEPLYFVGENPAKKVYPLEIIHITANIELKEDGVPCIIRNRGYCDQNTEYITNRTFEEVSEEIELWLTTPDMEMLFENYNVYNINYIDGYAFKGNCDMFKNYIIPLSEKKAECKKNNDHIGKYLAKGGLNRGYGKFGQKKVMNKKSLSWENGKAIYSGSDKVAMNTWSYVPVATFVTAYARQELVRVIRANKDRFLYSDTDSVHLAGLEPGLGMDIDPYKIGYWDCELVFDECKYLGRKIYAEKSKDGVKYTVAGLSKEYFENMKFEDFKHGKEFKVKRAVKVEGGCIHMVEKFSL